MQTEFEVKVLEIDLDKIRLKLRDLGAQFVGEGKMRRYVYDFSPIRKNSWVRLRDEGGNVNLTVKEIQDDGVDGTKELEVAVGDFDKMHLMLQKLGYVARAYQENWRESYLYNGVMLELDSWPMIPAYLEIEAASEIAVMEVLKELNLDESKVTSENTTKVYARYGIDIHAFKELRFENEI